MTPLHTIRLAHTPTSITIELDSPALIIEVRVRSDRRRHHVEVYRPLAPPSGALTKAGEFGAYSDPARAIEVALEVAHVLAVGLGVSALRGEASPPTTLVPPSCFPRTCDLVEAAQVVIARTVRIFRRSDGADLLVA